MIRVQTMGGAFHRSALARVAGAATAVILALTTVTSHAAICGDVAGGGTRNLGDVTLLNRAVLEEPDPPGLCGGAGAADCGDIDWDGAIRIADVVLLFNGILGNANWLPPCGEFEGFARGALTRAPRTPLTVTSPADSGPNTLRQRLAEAAALDGPKVILFAEEVSAITLLSSSGLRIPANTILSGAGHHPGDGDPRQLTIFGHNVTNDGVLNVYASNVVVRGIRIRNAAHDGIQIATKNGSSLSNVVVDRVSITNSADGAICVTGCVGLSITACQGLSPPPTVTDVTISNSYFAGNGAANGGASLIKYGASRITVVANMWDKNLRRNPTVDGDGSVGGSLADIRYNLLRSPFESWIQVVNGAWANVVGNNFEGMPDSNPDAEFVRYDTPTEGEFYAAGNVPSFPGTTASPFAGTPAVTPRTRQEVFNIAGAVPRDDVFDGYYIGLSSYGEVRSHPNGRP